MTSAYPKSVATLVEQVRRLAEREGTLPSRNRIIREFRVGPRKATDALAQLAPTEPANLDADPPVSGSVNGHLAAVPGDGGDQVGAIVAPGPGQVRRVRSWPLVVLALPAFVAIWSGWVGVGGLTGFGTIHPLPGIADGVTLNTAITLPIGVETYAAYALHVWLAGHHLTARARRFAKWSALAALGMGALGQVVFHIMIAAGMTAAPWPITTLVSCLPVVVLAAAQPYVTSSPPAMPRLRPWSESSRWSGRPWCTAAGAGAAARTQHGRTGRRPPTPTENSLQRSRGGTRSGGRRGRPLGTPDGRSKASG